MAVSTTIKYLGDLRTECTHLASGSVIRTDAPVDNKGKGEMFSPTDLCAAALASCAMTIMGMFAESQKLNVVGMAAEVSKTMSKEAPRRIVAIEVVITMPAGDYTDRQKAGFEKAASTCPVHHSLSEAMTQTLTILWP
jgi:Predicted redox protein, regulator of disulfide bond formation